MLEVIVSKIYNIWLPERSMTVDIYDVFHTLLQTDYKMFLYLHGRDARLFLY